MDLRLVFAESRNRRSEAVLPSAKSAWWQRGRQLRSSPARHQNSSQGAQGRLPSLRAQLLSPLPSRGASRRTRPHVGLSRRISLRRQETARVLISVVAIEPRFVFRSVDRIKPRGFAVGGQVYELVGTRAENDIRGAVR